METNNTAASSRPSIVEPSTGTAARPKGRNHMAPRHGSIVPHTKLQPFYFGTIYQNLKHGPKPVDHRPPKPWKPPPEYKPKNIYNRPKVTSKKSEPKEEEEKKVTFSDLKNPNQVAGHSLGSMQRTLGMFGHVIHKHKTNSGENRHRVEPNRSGETGQRNGVTVTSEAQENTEDGPMLSVL